MRNSWFLSDHNQQHTQNHEYKSQHAQQNAFGAFQSESIPPMIARESPNQQQYINGSIQYPSYNEHIHPQMGVFNYENRNNAQYNTKNGSLMDYNTAYNHPLNRNTHHTTHHSYNNTNIENMDCNDSIICASIHSSVPHNNTISQNQQNSLSTMIQSTQLLHNSNNSTPISRGITSIDVLNMEHNIVRLPSGKTLKYKDVGFKTRTPNTLPQLLQNIKYNHIYGKLNHYQFVFDGSGLTLTLFPPVTGKTHPVSYKLKMLPITPFTKLYNYSETGESGLSETAALNIASRGHTLVSDAFYDFFYFASENDSDCFFHRKTFKEIYQGAFELWVCTCGQQCQFKCRPPKNIPAATKNKTPQPKRCNECGEFKIFYKCNQMYFRWSAVGILKDV
eukprot:513193_1